MRDSRRPIAAALLILLTQSPVRAEPLASPMAFFEGKTEATSTTKIMMRKPYSTRNVGEGRIMADGSLTMVQQIEDQGKPPFQRRWHIRKVAPGRFSGTMSEAIGNVAIDEVGGRYRLRLKMKGGLSVEQWITPLPGGKSARSELTVRKLGMVVARGQGTIRKLS